MAVVVHIVRLRPIAVDATGAVIDKNKATIGQVARGGSTEPRVIPDLNIASSANYPTIEDYIIAEAAAGFVVRHIDQTMIITYPVGS